MSEFSHDLAIIGAGPAGYVAAIRASQLGLKTVLVEKDKPGGVCLNIGCIPSKSLLHQAAVFRGQAELAGMGVKIDASGFDYARVWQKSRDVSAKLSKGVAGLLRKNKVELLAGKAVIAGPHQLKVNLAGGSQQELRVKHIMVATGSRPKSIPGFEFDGDQVLSSDDLLMLQELPASLIILGAGAIGVEFACIMASFGVKVSLVEQAPRILPAVDPEAARVLETSLKALGVQVYAGAQTGELDYEDDLLSLPCATSDGAKHQLLAEKLLVAVGRSPNTEQLGLESLGVKTERGFIPVGDYFQTSCPGVFAVGDVIDTPQLAHLASKEGETVVEYLAGKAPAPRLDPAAIPYAVYAHPELAGFGPSLDELEKAGVAASAFSFPFLGVGRAIASEDFQGFVKLIQAKDDGRLLAATVVGPGATELIHELLLAREAGLSAQTIAHMVHAHPTLSEGVMEAARGLGGWAIHI